MVGVEALILRLLDFADVVAGAEPLSGTHQFLRDLAVVESTSVPNSEPGQGVVPVIPVNEENGAVCHERLLEKNPGVWPKPDTGGIKPGTPWDTR